MFPLNQNSKLEAFLGSSPASNIQWSVGYIDLPPQTNAATEQQRGNTFRSVSSATADVMICPYPGQSSSSSTAGQPAWVRNILYVKGYNPNAGAVTATIQINDGNDDIQYSCSIPAGGTVYYEDKSGWYVQNSSGQRLVSLSDNGSFVNLTVSGNTTLGDAAADSLTINAGVFSAPNIPCFSAYNSVTDTNQTGNGATATVQFDTEAYDQGNNFSANTFTAPVTGKYFLSATVRLGSLTAAMTDIVCQIVTTARTYSNDWNITPVAAGGSYSCIVTCQADMSATDTAQVKVTVANGAGNTASIVGSTTQLTFFCGHQIA